VSFLTREQWEQIEALRAMTPEERRVHWCFPQRTRRADLPPTAREVEVLVLVADGLTNEAIAARLTITVETVKSHLRNLTAKLGARNRAHLVARGFLAGHIRAGLPSG